MSKAEEVLSTLQNDDVWYFAKQDTSFDNAYKAVRIFDQVTISVWRLKTDWMPMLEYCQ